MKTIEQVLEDAGIIASVEQINQLKSLLVLKGSVQSKGGGKIYYHRSSEFAPKTPLQMRQLVLVLHDLGSATVADWALLAGESLTTRQDPAKIIAYYKKRMLQDGLISTEPQMVVADETETDETELTAGESVVDDEPEEHVMDTVPELPELEADEDVDPELQAAVDEAMEEIG